MEDLTTTATRPQQPPPTSTSTTATTTTNKFSSWPPVSFHGVNVEQVVNYCEQIEVTPSRSVMMDRSLVPVRTKITEVVNVCVYVCTILCPDRQVQYLSLEIYHPRSQDSWRLFCCPPHPHCSVFSTFIWPHYSTLERLYTLVTCGDVRRSEMKC